MPSENEATTERMQWGRLIRAIATASGPQPPLQPCLSILPRGSKHSCNVQVPARQEPRNWRRRPCWRSGGRPLCSTRRAPVRQPGFSRSPEICVSTPIGAIRRGGVIETSDVEIEFQIDDSPQPDSRLATAQSEERVRSALSQLSADQIRVVELSFFEEKAHAEIAKILGIPTGNGQVKAALGHEPASQSAE